MKKTLLSLIALLAASSAQANDTAFGGTGSNLMPITHTEISMQDEVIQIDGQLYEGRLDAWKTEVTFHFKNESDKPQKLQMGFPFRRPSGIELEETPFVQPHGYPQDPKELIHEFKATVRGKPIEAKEFKLDLKQNDEESLMPRYDFAYLWEIEFAPHETVEIKNSYITGVTTNSMTAQYVDYILRTGANWKGGKIGHSHIEVRPHVNFMLCGDANSDMFSTTAEPEGYRTEGNGDQKKIIWDLKDYTPKKDVEVCLITDRNYPDLLTMSGDLDNENMTAEQLRIARNLVYAKYGYVFKDPDLKAYFGKQWWYKENPNYNVKQLTEWDLQRIQQIKKREAELKKKK